MDRLRICEILGVEPGEMFRYDSEKYRAFLDENGEITMTHWCNCGHTSDGTEKGYWDGDVSTNLLIEMINHPSEIYHIAAHGWTQTDKDDAIAVRRLFKNAKVVKRVWMSGDEILVMDDDLVVPIVRIRNDRLFPSLMREETAALKEIMEE